jgi:hypothetical protein
MNTIDRKIAHLRGIATWPDGFEGPTAFPTWSTSDGMAMELVDELVSAHPDFGATLIFASEGNRLWHAAFHFRNGPEFLADGPSRTAVVCEAYIATREWLDAQRP